MSDVLVIGGGVMGLMTAYHASGRGARVTVLERGRIGDPMTASYGKTRSYRSDYLDGEYVRFAREAMTLWERFEADTGTRALIRCGCMNIAKRDVTPELDRTYAELSRTVLDRLNVELESFDRAGLQARFPDLDADVGHLEAEAGVVDLQAVRHTLQRVLAERGVTVLEGVEVTAVADGIAQTADHGTFGVDALVVTAGHGTNGVLERIDGCDLQVPIAKDRPTEAKYVTPAPEDRDRFLADAMPVVAYLDTGIYLHPIVPGVCEAVKIGYYNPPDLLQERTGVDSVAAFIETCLPGLRGARVEDVTETDGCDYDLVADDDFVLGRVGGLDSAANAFVGVGWRGTGYKFAPWIGRVLAELATQEGTVYDIARFDPARFSERNSGAPFTAATAG